MKTLDRDLILAIIGLSSIAVGLALIFVPAAFVAVGFALLAYAIVPDQRAAP